MKQFCNSILPISLLIILFICLPSLVQAQGGPGDPCNDPHLYCPIDGGLIPLLALGVGYGIKKVREARRSEI